MAAQPDLTLLTAEQFLGIEWGSDIKAELDNGVIRMMAGGTRAHARVQMNLYRFLGGALRGSGCRPFGSDMAVRTHDLSVRYPDMSVDCHGDAASEDEEKTLRDPRVVIEILSPTTRRQDEGVKLNEYRALGGIDTIVFIDPVAERLRVLQRTGPDAWSDRTHPAPADLHLPALGLVVPHAEIFARD
ncbi:MAG TPA: Uma2 family endonuclease [Sphingomonas sp.]|jgi:Uma2 family endonuclease|uniref:Uma2 family endonuclease n=1 Tax=Sphingomonas sp. TaxID=28214 RepID=UPI002ED8348D